MMMKMMMNKKKNNKLKHHQVNKLKEEKIEFIFFCRGFFSES
jgi:hypothetical protein